MKKLIAFLLLIAGPAFATPFLVCTPIVAGVTVPTSYTITGLGSTPITTPAVTNSNGTVQVHYDVSAVPAGAYTITVTATNSAGISASSAPFTFTLPVAVTPAVPLGLSLSP